MMLTQLVSFLLSFLRAVVRNGDDRAAHVAFFRRPAAA